MAGLSPRKSNITAPRHRRTRRSRRAGTECTIGFQPVSGWNIATLFENPTFLQCYGRGTPGPAPRGPGVSPQSSLLQKCGGKHTGWIFRERNIKALGRDRGEPRKQSPGRLFPAVGHTGNFWRRRYRFLEGDCDRTLRLRRIENGRLFTTTHLPEMIALVLRGLSRLGASPLA
jgi:hypothetical protein